MIREKLFIFFILMILYCSSIAQFREEATRVLTKLDSIRNSSCVSKHFASIYFDVTSDAIGFFSKADTNMQRLMGRLERRFADFFFRSVDAFEKKKTIPDVWKTYYADTTGPGLRYILMGINAHINGDIWQALTTEFSLSEIQDLKPLYLVYKKQLLKNYLCIYDAALLSSKRMRLIHAVSLGLDKAYGKVLLRRWRKRQIKLAELYYTNRSLFEKKINKLHRKMNRLDQLICKNI